MSEYNELDPLNLAQGQSEPEEPERTEAPEAEVPQMTGQADPEATQEMAGKAVTSEADSAVSKNTEDGTYSYSYRKSVENPEEYRRPPYMRDEIPQTPKQEPFEFKLRAANSEDRRDSGETVNNNNEYRQDQNAGTDNDNRQNSGRYDYGSSGSRTSNNRYSYDNPTSGGGRGGSGGNGRDNYDWQNGSGRGPKKSNKKKIALVIAICALVGGLVGMASWSIGSLIGGSTKTEVSSDLNRLIGDADAGEETQESSQEAAQETQAAQDSQNSSAIATAPAAESESSVVVTDVTDVVDLCMPSVVAITTKTVYEYYNNYGYNPFYGYYGYGSGSGESNTYEVEGAGSGIIIGDDGEELWIVTNNHVVEDSDEVNVSFCDDSSVSAYIKGTDPSNDLAVVGVKIADLEESTKSAITAIRMGDSDSLRLGESVIAIGNALGIGQSVTTGVVSALNREITTDEDTTLTTIQTDAAINPGNSGGALLNSKGELIGINVAKSSESNTEGMGFAIPISSAKEIIENLTTMEPREAVSEDQYPYLGVQLKDMNSSVASSYGIPEGILVYSIEDDSPAAKGGMMVQDIITAFNGVEVSTYEEMVSELQYYAGGTEVTITVQRLENGSYVEKELKVTLGLKSDYATEESAESQEQESGSGIEQFIPGYGNDR